jgi:hypothetical protein
LCLELFGPNPMPRFSDVFLLGIVLIAYLFSWLPINRLRIRADAAEALAGTEVEQRSHRSRGCGTA